jgi:sugar transferase (PEP-CTERM/EpsH1 system associated)
MDFTQMSGEKIKILHVIDSLDIGGMERVVVDVVNNLDPLQFDQSVCCISRIGEMAAQLRGDVRCIDLAKGEKGDHLMPLKLASIIRRENPGVIHTQSWSGIDAAIAKMIARRGRVVHSEHGRSYPHIHSEPLKRRIARRCLYHLADAVFAVSSEVRDYYCRQTGFPSAKMRVISNGIDVRRIDRMIGPAMRRELKIGADDFVVGTVARLDATKDTITLARAFAKLYLSRCRTDLKLLIVGDGDQRKTIEAFVAGHGLRHAVIFTGMRCDAPGLLGAMDVFALPSLSEGMPVTVLEAMSARLPVVAANVGALPEMVVEGVTGFLVEPRDPDVLAERLSRFLADRGLALQFGAAARRKVENDHSLDSMLKRYADLYRSVML